MQAKVQAANIYFNRKNANILVVHTCNLEFNGVFFLQKHIEIEVDILHIIEY